MKHKKSKSHENSIPAFGLIYFDHLKGQYKNSPTEKLKESENLLLKELSDKDRSLLTWNDLYLFDLVLVKIQPIEKLRRKVWSLRSRYREVAGIREYDAYLASKPPDLASEAVDKSEEILRADIDFLMGEIYVRYAIEPIRQSERNILSKYVGWIIFIGLSVIVAFFFYVLYSDLIKKTPLNVAGSPFIVAMFSGAMGGIISIQQRFESLTNEGDPINNIYQLTLGRLGAFVSATTGAASAVVLYLIFAGGLLSGDIFPEMVDIPKGSVLLKDVSFMEFFREAGPNSTKDFAKLIVWSFIAGFAERFVPDTLSRFISRKQTGNEVNG